MHAAERLIIGNVNDPHVESVVKLLQRPGTVVVDAATLDDTIVEHSYRETVLRDLAGRNVAVRETGCRGWLRRLAPAGHDNGIEIGSLPAARLSARLALLGSIVRDRRVQWLSDPSAVFAAENKITQYQFAADLQVAVPPATSSRSSTRSAVSESPRATPTCSRAASTSKPAIP